MKVKYSIYKFQKNYATNKCFKNSGYTPSQQFSGHGKHYAKLMQDVPEHHYLFVIFNLI